jgi:hypothetical protein
MENKVCPCDKCSREHPGCTCAKALEWYKKQKLLKR